MRRLKPYFDVFVISGFVTSFFYGFLNPLYVSVILARLDVRVIAVGSFMSSAFPVLIGALLGRKRIFDRLYAALPAVMLVELVAAVASALAAAVDVAAYYLASMFILGVFSASVIFLMQRIKEVTYRRSRAAFDRRMAMADALGSMAGSTIAFIGIVELQDPVLIAVLSSAQTVIVYGLFLLLYRKKPERSAGDAEEEPHPWPRARALGVRAA
jgi:hypothetical protein